MYCNNFIGGYYSDSDSDNDSNSNSNSNSNTNTFRFYLILIISIIIIIIIILLLTNKKIVPTTIVPTTIVPTTIVPTTIVPTIIVPKTIVPTTIVPTTIVPTTIVQKIIVPTTIVPQVLIKTTIPTQITPYPTIDAAAAERAATAARAAAAAAARYAEMIAYSAKITALEAEKKANMDAVIAEEKAVWDANIAASSKRLPIPEGMVEFLPNNNDFYNLSSFHLNATDDINSMDYNILGTFNLPSDYIEGSNTNVILSVFAFIPVHLRGGSSDGYFFNIASAPNHSSILGHLYRRMNQFPVNMNNFIISFPHGLGKPGDTIYVGISANPRNVTTNIYMIKMKVVIQYNPTTILPIPYISKITDLTQTSFKATWLGGDGALSYSYLLQDSSLPLGDHQYISPLLKPLIGDTVKSKYFIFTGLSNKKTYSLIIAAMNNNSFIESNWIKVGLLPSKPIINVSKGKFYTHMISWNPEDGNNYSWRETHNVSLLTSDIQSNSVDFVTYPWITYSFILTASNQFGSTDSDEITVSKATCSLQGNKCIPF